MKDRYGFDVDPSDYEDGLPEGFCKNCGEPCTAISVDEGIGPYEYWGMRGNDSRVCIVSPCCHDDVTQEKEQ